MLTLFTVPKPFKGYNGIIQRNAIQSWTRIFPDGEILLCGDDCGTEEAAIEFRTKYVPDIERNEYGTPLLSSIFEKACQKATRPLLCYLNADIILMDDFNRAVFSIPFKNYLMIGRRWDLSLTQEWNFELPDWQERLKSLVAKKGSLHPVTGIDYFAFPHGGMGHLPPFAVGRPAWDNWMVYRARVNRVPVVDATLVTTVVHQNHDYSHVKDAADNTTEGPEATINRELVAGWDKMFNVRDATHILKPTTPASRNAPCILRRKWLTLPVPLLRMRKKLGYVTAAGVRVVRRRLTS
jgi:hypothetical protein